MHNAEVSRKDCIVISQNMKLRLTAPGEISSQPSVKSILLAPLLRSSIHLHLIESVYKCITNVMY